MRAGADEVAFSLLVLSAHGKAILIAVALVDDGGKAAPGRQVPMCRRIRFIMQIDHAGGGARMECERGNVSTMTIGAPQWRHTKTGAAEPVPSLQSDGCGAG